jgi:hypothetical protein
VEVEVALDVGWEDAVQCCYYLVAERAGGVGDGVGAAEEVEDAHWVGLVSYGTSFLFAVFGGASRA